MPRQDRSSQRLDPYRNINWSPKEITGHVYAACIWRDPCGLVASLERNRATEAPGPRTEPPQYPRMAASVLFWPGG